MEAASLASRRKQIRASPDRAPGMKKLQGHGPLEPTVFGSKDDAHASFAEGLEHAVVAKRTVHRPTAFCDRSDSTGESVSVGEDGGAYERLE